MSELLQRLLLLGSLGTIIVGSPAYAQDPSNPVEEQRGCEIHIWQRGIYVSEAAANYAAFGLLGAILQAEHDRKYPANSVEGLMESSLNIDTLPTALSSIVWKNYTGSEINTVVYEHAPVSDGDFKALKEEAARKTTSQSVCYIELYIGKLTFSGGAIKSHLFGDIYARTFYGKRFTAKSASLWDQTRKVRLTDENSVANAKETFRLALANILIKFMQNKLPRP